MIDLHLKSEIDPVAMYAAIISSIALALAIWNALRSGPRLVVQVATNIMVIGTGNPATDEKGLIQVVVINRGDAPTTLISLDVNEYDGMLNTWRRKAVKSYVIPNPQLISHRPNLPCVLKPFEKWNGYIRPRPDVFNPENGKHYVSVRASHRDKPVEVRIPKKEIS